MRITNCTFPTDFTIDNTLIYDTDVSKHNLFC